jgi:hypothetical protein
MIGVMEPVAGTGVALCGSGQLSSFASSAFHSRRGPGLQAVPGGLRDLELDRLPAAKLEQLRDDVRHGLESGTSQPWSAEDAKRKAYARRERKLA